MIRQSTCILLAVALAAASFFPQVTAQSDQLIPAGSGINQGLEDAQNAGGSPSCTCDCCHAVAARTPVAGASATCGPENMDPTDTESACPAKCASTDPLDNVIKVASDGTVDYVRYCTMTCVPDEMNDGKLGETCRRVTAKEQSELLTAGGNGRDPATLNDPKPPTIPQELKDPDAPPEAPQLADAQAEQEASDKAAAEEAGRVEADAGVEEQKEEKDTGAMVTQASGKQALAASMEARLTEAEASSAQSLSVANGDLEASKSNSLMITAAQAQVKAAEVRADIYAKSAAKAAKRAAAELKDIMEIPQRAAEVAAAEAKKRVQDEVNEQHGNLLWVKSRLAPPPLPVPLAEAAVKAAGPYYAVMNKAIAMGNLYEANAHNLQDQAQTAQEQSREVASQAVVYQSAGNGEMAAKLMAQAKDLLSQAQAKDAEARKAFAVAEGVRKQVPNYQVNAAAASARATTIANPGGQPPPAMAAGFLQLHHGHM